MNHTRGTAPSYLAIGASVAAVVAAWALSGGFGQQVTAQVNTSFLVHLPIALHDTLALRTPSAVSPTPSRVPTIGPSATFPIPPSATPSTTPTPIADVPVIVQIATGGGLHPDTQFGVERVQRSPWFTLYESGVVVGFPQTGGRLQRYAPVTLVMAEDDVWDLVERLAVESAFFTMVLPDESGLCVTDLDTTYVHVAAPDGSGVPRSRTVAIYGLDWYLGGEAPCRPRSGTPEPPSTEVIALANTAAALRQSLSDAAAWWPSAGTLVVTRDNYDEGRPTWPLPQDLALVSNRFLQTGELPLPPAQVPPAVAAIGGQVSRGWSMARFNQRSQSYVVGLRLEPPRWDTYRTVPVATPTAETTPGTPGTASPSPTNASCPPVRPMCTAGPPPTRCAGPGCPTPDPCPCHP